MPYTPILATLGYIFSPDGRQVLLVHRTKRPTDPHFGKYNGLGGKLHADEDVVACIQREIREEADLECLELRLCGTISWPGFGQQGEDWFGFIFRIDAWRGTPRPDNPEGSLSWVDIDQVLSLPLWEGDRYFLPLVLERGHGQFHGVMPYRGGKPAGWTVHWVSEAPGENNRTPLRRGDDRADELIRQARRLLARCECDKVIDHLDIHRPAEWVVVDRQGARVLRLLGQAYVRRGNWRLACECLEQLRAVQGEHSLLEPITYAAALTDLLHCYEHIGHSDLALGIRKEVQLLLQS
jgi:8-oxo-dGTP diphosphatase